MREHDVRTWVDGLVDDGPVALERIALGRSRVTYRTRGSGAASRIVRVDTGSGPLSGTELTLRREAAIYTALAGTGVPVPALLGVSPDGAAMLMETVPGDSELGGLSPTERYTLYDDYLDRLADLHRLDVGRLDLGPLAGPRTAGEATADDLGRWERAFRLRTSRPRPVPELAFRMLRRLAPPAPGPAVLTHGDAGPKNFMHAGGRVTALIDWEFGHVGDPMDDLAWWAFRGHELVGDCGDLAAQLQRWSARAGVPVDHGRLRYLRALVVLRVLVVVGAALDNTGPGQEGLVYLALEGFVSTRLVLALADLAGVTLSGAAPAPSAPPGPARDAVLALGNDIDSVVRPAVSDPAALQRLAFTDQLVAHLLAADAFGHALHEAERADLNTLLGTPVADVESGRARLAGAVRAGDGDEAELIEVLWRWCQGAARLWPLTAGRAFAPVHPLLRAAERTSIG